MPNTNKTIATRIADLSRRTNAPETFVKQVRSLFSGKGISLDEDCTPYMAALEQAFQREESIRRNTLVTKQNLSRLQKNFSAITDNYRRHASQLARIKSSLERHSKKISSNVQKIEGKGRKPSVVLYSSNPRTYITRPQKEKMPMVPGPDEIQ